jgi:hypothetical protein
MLLQNSSQGADLKKNQNSYDFFFGGYTVLGVPGGNRTSFN